jgi:hypothetical protein
LLTGLNLTVFAYGATGAGKTHTMLGSTRSDETAANAEAGIIPNAVCDLFQQITDRKRARTNTYGGGEDWSVILSYIEVYNEQVYDLLETSGKVLSLREDSDRGVVIVAGVTEQKVENYDDVLELLQQGNKNRKTEATMANAVSSRSHAVLQLTVKHTRRLECGRESVVESKLSMIDLAGSERASATNNRGARLQEGANINKSLLALANCINALSSNSLSTTQTKGNVKYRDSKLTHLLKSSLEGNCNLVMIANINPSHLTYEDSHNTLKYANRAKNLKVNPVMKDTVKDNNWIEREARLRDENEQLRQRVQELERIIAGMNGGIVSLAQSRKPGDIFSANFQNTGPVESIVLQNNFVSSEAQAPTKLKSVRPSRRDTLLNKENVNNNSGRRHCSPSPMRRVVCSMSDDENGDDEVVVDVNEVVLQDLEDTKKKRLENPFYFSNVDETLKTRRDPDDENDDCGGGNGGNRQQPFGHNNGNSLTRTLSNNSNKSTPANTNSSSSSNNKGQRKRAIDVSQQLDTINEDIESQSRSRYLVIISCLFALDINESIFMLQCHRRGAPSQYLRNGRTECFAGNGGLHVRHPIRQCSRGRSVQLRRGPHTNSIPQSQ